MTPYENYVPSGVEWIGDIPAGWKIKKLKYIAKICNGQDYKDVEAYDGNFPVIGSGGEFAKADSYLYGKESVLLGRKGTIDCPLFIDVPFWTVDTMYYTDIDHKYSRRYFYYLCTTINFEMYQYGSAIPSMSQRDLKEIKFAVPQYIEQQTIADYLDTQTTRIDNIIKAKQTLIEHLKEKRTALITHAVTKGLDPHAKMKPSGIDWIGDIPDGWEVTKLKYVVKTKITDGPHTTPELVPDGIPFVSAEAVKNNKVNLELMRGYISIEDHKEFCQKCRPQKGDIFMIKSGATTGNIAIVDFDTEFSIWSPLALIRAKESEFEQRYVFYSMLSDFFVKQVSNSWSFGTQQNIGMGVIENLAIFAPHKDEQKLIVKMLDQKVPAIDSAIAKTLLSIEKLRESRTALISACVTGKLDVRSV